MKKKITRKEAQGKIEEFFKQKNLDAKYVKKIKRLAMKYNLKLGKYRKKFCRKCFSDLRNGKVRLTRYFKVVECGGCGARARWRVR